MFDYNKDRSKNTIIAEANGVYSLCLYRETQVIYFSTSLQDVLDFAKDKSNEEMIKIYKSIRGL